MTWERFESAAGRYDALYEASRGRRASRAEKELLAWLLEPFPEARSILDVGCGTGHFTAWLAARGWGPVGLDRAPGMLERARRRLPDTPLLLADAERLPLRDRSVDLVVFVTTLEFLGSPERALGEAVRVARRGIAAIVLNRWSLGALSRRWGPQAHGSLLSQAHDLSLLDLRGLFRRAVARRLVGLRWRSALLPRPLPAGPVRSPLGDVVGIAAALASEAGRYASC